MCRVMLLHIESSTIPSNLRQPGQNTHLTQRMIQISITAKIKKGNKNLKQKKGEKQKQKQKLSQAKLMPISLFGSLPCIFSTRAIIMSVDR